MTATDPLATTDLHERAHRHLLMHFTRHGAFGPDGKRLLVLERGEGAYVFDTEGRRYLDGLSSLFCCQIGYSFGEEMAAVAGRQLTTLAFNTNWATAHPPAIELAEALAERAPGDINRVFFTNGGSESVEAAWKIIRQHYLAKRRAAAHEGGGARDRLPRRHARRPVVHRRAADEGALRPGADPGRPRPQHQPLPRARRRRRGRVLPPAPGARPSRRSSRRGPETVAMIIAEPVQNAGGGLVPPEGYWAGLRAMADRYGIALVADEVITGFGRIGEWFAAPRYGATPDLITVAKGITSAYAPMGAVLVSDRIAEPLYEDGRMLLHGITFGGHPVAAAIARQNVEIFDREGVLENVRAQEGYLGGKLRELQERLPIVGDVRGAGFFWALELVRDAEGGRFSAEERERLLRGFLGGRLLDEGLIARPDDRGDAVLHLAPPLVCGPAELDELVAKTEAVLADASDRFFAI